MICPMTRRAGSAGANCSKSCAWWLEDRCDVNSIAKSLREISTALQVMSDDRVKEIIDDAYDRVAEADTDQKVGEQNADPKAE